MAASSESLTREINSLNEEWKVVLPRRGRHRRAPPKIVKHEEHQWAPSDTEVDLCREAKLMKRIEVCLKRVESSKFYRAFTDQIQSPEIVDLINKVLGSDPKMDMVVYGIGSIESSDPPRLQLCLALLLKRNLNWIGDMEIFDPILSATESRVMEALGCSVLSVNEQGCRRAVKPTLFYMPHCEAELYDNLLRANWEMGFLNNVVVLGNSFEMYEHVVSVNKSPILSASSRHILAVRKFTNEHKISTISENDFFAAFHDSSWHFFNLHSEMQLPQI